MMNIMIKNQVILKRSLHAYAEQLVGSACVIATI